MLAAHTPRTNASPRAPGMSLRDRYFAAWALVLPVSSVLVVPFIQGTTPAYVFALMLLLPPVTALVLGLEEGLAFFKQLAWLAAGFVALNALAQISLAAAAVERFGDIQLVDPFDRSVVLRSTLFTQSLYLLAAGSTFVYARRFYSPRWDAWFLAGAVLLGLYGVYEVAFFAATGLNGDFLSNRRFGGGSFTGSWFQTIALGPLVLQRLKSLTGEPSMYAFTVLPFWIYALHSGPRWVHLFLLGTLLASTSTTAMAGIGCYIFIRLLFYGPTDRVVFVALLAVVAVGLLAAGGNQYVLDAFDKIFATKLSFASGSGSSRLQSFEINLRYFLGEPLLTQLFGIGFGYIRATNMFATLLINLGVVGVLVVAIIFAVPLVRLGASERERGIKAALAVIFITLMLSVPEFSYLSTWLFLGIAYHEVGKRRTQHARRPSIAPVWQPRG